MPIIKGEISTNKVGSTSHFEFEAPDDATPEEIEKEACRPLSNWLIGFTPSTASPRKFNPTTAMRRLFFDTETTGKMPKHDRSPEAMPRVVQLAAVLISDEGEVASINVLIQPDGWEIPAEASAIHGITTEMAAACGIPIRSALSLFSNLCRVSDQTVAHNWAFDEPVITCELKRLGQPSRLLEVPSFCTMQAATNVCRIPGPYGFKWPKLQEAHLHFFGHEFEGAHDALADVRACARIFTALHKLPNQPTP